jgi:hypothetical protein
MQGVWCGILGAGTLLLLVSPIFENSQRRQEPNCTHSTTDMVGKIHGVP